MTADQEVAAGRILWALRHTKGLRESEVRLYALGIDRSYNVKELLAHLETRGLARKDGVTWRAVE